MTSNKKTRRGNPPPCPAIDHGIKPVPEPHVSRKIKPIEYTVNKDGCWVIISHKSKTRIKPRCNLFRNRYGRTFKRSRNSTYCHLGFRESPQQEKPFLYSSVKFVTEHLRHLSHPAVACYLAIASMVHIATQVTRISYRRLENLTGYSRDSVIRGIKELKRKGLLYTFSFNDGIKCNEYGLKSLNRSDSARGLPRYEKPFWWISKYFVTDQFLKDLPGAAVKVYLCIACAENGNNRFSRISHKKIAEWAGISVSTVIRAIKVIEKYRLIIVYRSTDSVYCNEYRLMSLKGNVKGEDVRIRSGNDFAQKNLEAEQERMKEGGSRTGDTPTIALLYKGRFAANDFTLTIISALTRCQPCSFHGLAQLLFARALHARLRSLIFNGSFRNLSSNFVPMGQTRCRELKRYSESQQGNGSKSISIIPNKKEVCHAVR